MAKRRGVSYEKRVEEINRIYDQYAKRGVPNREIWRRYVYLYMPLPNVHSTIYSTRARMRARR